MSVEEHRALAGGAAVRAVVLVVSTTRTLDDDVSGRFIVERLAEGGIGGADRRIVDDDASSVASAVQDAVRDGVRLVILTGGTGISGRDVTPEAVEPLFRKALPGFGEIFRLRSFQQIGSAAMLSRATAGIVDDALVFAMPGSRKACDLALTELILPEVAHLLQQLDKEPVAAAAAPAGWERAVVDGTIERGARPGVPPVLQGFAPAEQLLAESGEAAHLTIADRRYTVWGFPDLGPRSKVVAVGDGPDLEIVALHRHHPTGIGASAWWAPPGDAEARVDAVVGHPLPVAGTWFGCTSDAVFVESDGRVLRFDGRRTADMGTARQALATLMLEFVRR